MRRGRYYIYLAGNVPKGQSEDEPQIASSEEVSILEKLLAPGEIIFFNPLSRSDDLNDNQSVYGRDLLAVYLSHLVLVDARDKRGVGVGVEMQLAKQYGTPIVSVVPKNSHYRRDKIKILGTTVKNWVHPFIETMSDFIAEDFEEAGNWIKRNMLENYKPTKGADLFQRSVYYYMRTQLENDTSMKTLIDDDPSLREKINRIANKNSFRSLY